MNNGSATKIYLSTWLAWGNDLLFWATAALLSFIWSDGGVYVNRWGVSLSLPDGTLPLLFFLLAALFKWRSHLSGQPRLGLLPMIQTAFLPRCAYWLQRIRARRSTRRYAVGGLLLTILVSFSSLYIVHRGASKHGLIGDYYLNTTWQTPPVLTVHDRTISLHRMKHELAAHSQNYSIRWSGWLWIPDAGLYQFELASDDGSTLELDGQLIVDNSGFHGLERRTGQIELSRGLHTITLHYMQGAADAALKISWQRPAHRWIRLPSAFLFPFCPSPLRLWAEWAWTTAWRLVQAFWGFGGFLLFLVLWTQRAVLWSAMQTAMMRSVVGRILRWVFRPAPDAPAFAWWPQALFPLPKAFWLILALNALLNVGAIWWGLPGVRGWAPDELTPQIVQEAMHTGFANGWHDKYPPLHYYLLTVCHVPFWLLEQLDIIVLKDFNIYTILFFLQRFLSVIMGAGIVFLVYVCGRELYDQTSALFATLIAALLMPLVYFAKIANLDVPYTFWFMASLYFYLRLLKHDSPALNPLPNPSLNQGGARGGSLLVNNVVKWQHRRDYLLFATFSVCAVCTKDQAYGLYVLMPLPLLMTAYRQQSGASVSRRLAQAAFSRAIILAGLWAILLFGLLHNWIFNWAGFWHHVHLITGAASVGYRIYEPTLSGHASMFWQSLTHLRFSFGWPVFVVCVAGLVFECCRPRKNWRLLALLVPAISYYLTFISVILYNYVRFFIPICLIFALFGGSLLGALWHALPRLRLLKSLVLFLLFGYTLWYAASVDVLMLSDSRYTVERWLKAHLDPQTSSLGLLGLGENLPRTRWFTHRKFLFSPSIEAIQELNAEYLIANADQGIKHPDWYQRLNDGRLGYTLVFQYRTDVAWLPLNRSVFVTEDGRKKVFTNLEKINPEIRVYHRND